MELLRKYNQATTVIFPLLDYGNTDNFVASLTLATGDVQISKDFGSFSNTGSLTTHVANGVYTLPLTAAEMQCETACIKIVDQTATKEFADTVLLITTSLGAWVEGNQSIITGSVNNAAFTPTTTAFEADRLAPNTTEEQTADHMNNKLVMFVTGSNLGCSVQCTDFVYANSREKYTVSALPAAPANGDRFIVV
ncbi:MAG: hypothetical protein GOVbin7744_20 [Prokaryotic dsDNA virus sp.]|nr:MAG: hypothetical protein GOVbin7744_20 [Prokaryotic dsDNA virus sp.]|tara:strand:+ start:6092 stop:6673 length:582 start_codon:yes stop_codon:yes gene_type:complete